MNIQRGDLVRHPIHGVGTVNVISPDGYYAVVQYPMSEGLPEFLGDHYSRTHHIATYLTKVEHQEAVELGLVEGMVPVDTSGAEGMVVAIATITKDEPAKPQAATPTQIAANRSARLKAERIAARQRQQAERERHVVTESVLYVSSTSKGV